MKFRLLTSAERAELKKSRLTKWHKWFTWRPIRLTVDQHEVRWLETVYRVGRHLYCEDGSYYSWRYADNTADVLRDVGNNQEE